MFPGSRPKWQTLLGGGAVIVVFGLFLVLSAAVGRTAAGFALFGYILGFVLLSFGVGLMVLVVAYSRRD